MDETFHEIRNWYVRSSSTEFWFSMYTYVCRRNDTHSNVRGCTLARVRSCPARNKWRHTMRWETTSGKSRYRDRYLWPDGCKNQDTGYDVVRGNRTRGTRTVLGDVPSHRPGTRTYPWGGLKGRTSGGRPVSRTTTCPSRACPRVRAPQTRVS